MQTLRRAFWVALAVTLVMPAAMASAIDFSNMVLTLAPTSSTINDLSLTATITPTALSSQTQTKPATIRGDCSATLNAAFDPTSHQATISDITFNLDQSRHISLQDTSFAFSWKVLFVTVASANVNTSSILLSPYTPAPPTPVSNALFPASQVSATFNGGNIIYSYQSAIASSSGTENLANSPLSGPNTDPGSGTVAISNPTMNGTVANYTATVTLPLLVNEPLSGTGYTAQISATGTLKASGTFQFDFGPRQVNWNTSSGNFSTGGNWDVGFAPRAGDTAVIKNSGTSALTTNFAGSPAAVWIGSGGTTSGMLTVGNGGSLSCGTVVFGQTGGTGTLALSGGTLSTQSLALGSGGNGTVYFDAGVLRATGNNTQFLAGLNAVDIRAGGATIDSNGYKVTIGQALQPDPALGTSHDGGLRKTGLGTLILAGANTYSGGTTVDEGTLVLANSAALKSGTSLTIGANAATIFGSSTVMQPGVEVGVALPVPEPNSLVLLLAVLIVGFRGWGAKNKT